MKPKRNKPFKTSHLVIRLPSLEPSSADRWIARTYALIDAFEEDRWTHSLVDRSPAASYIIAASDHLWETHRLHASWERLELTCFFERYASLAIMLGWRIDCLGALVEFYGYLAQNNIVSRDAAIRIQIELQGELHELLNCIEDEAPLLDWDANDAEHRVGAYTSQEAHAVAEP